MATKKNSTIRPVPNPIRPAYSSTIWARRFANTSRSRSADAARVAHANYAVGGAGGLPVTSNLVVHLDAKDDSSVTHVAGAVSQWTDLSGNDHHFTQSGAGKPTYDLTDVIAFDGVDDYLENSSFLPVVASDTQGEIITISRAASSANLGVSLMVGGNLDSEWFHPYYDTSGRAQHYNDNGAGATNQIRTAAISNTDVWKITSYSSNGSRYKIEVNGTDYSLSVVTGADDGKWWNGLPQMDANRVNFGLWERASNVFRDCEMRAFLYYSQELSDADRTSVVNYLNGRFSIY